MLTCTSASLISDALEICPTLKHATSSKQNDRYVKRKISDVAGGGKAGTRTNRDGHGQTRTNKDEQGQAGPVVVGFFVCASPCKSVFVRVPPCSCSTSAAAAAAGRGRGVRRATRRGA